MNERSDSADLEIRNLVDALEPDGLGAIAGEGFARSSAEASPAGETLDRESLELLGLLALDAEPAAPRAQVKERLMAALAAEARGEGETASAAERSVASAPVPFEPERVEPRVARSGGRAAWWSLAAAVLALAALGVAGALWTELTRSRATLAQLEQEQQRLVDRLEQQEDVLGQAVRLGSMVTVASTPGVEICPLRPVGERPVAPGAFAVLYMPPGQMDWYLVATNLKPAQGGVYKVWLNTDDGSMPGGVMESNPLTDGQMSVRIPPSLFQEGRMLSVTITLEPAAEVESPSGPMVLFGDEKMRVL